MSVAAGRPIRDDGLSRTTLQIGRGVPASSVAEVIRALQRVPGVLTVDADAENTQAFVAHDAGVPTEALIAAARRGGVAAKAVTVPCAAVLPVEIGAPRQMQRHRYLAAVGLAAMLAIVLIDVALPNSPEKRWFLNMPVVLLWAFILLRATRSRRS